MAWCASVDAASLSGKVVRTRTTGVFKKSSDAVDMHAILALDVDNPHSANRPITRDAGRRLSAVQTRLAIEKGQAELGLSSNNSVLLAYSASCTSSPSASSGRSISMTSAIGALSPWRKPNFKMLRYPP